MKKFFLFGLGKAKELIEQLEDKVKEDNPPPSSEPAATETAKEPAPAEQAALPGITAPELSNFEDRKPMNDLLRKWEKTSGQTLKELKARVREHAGVMRIDYMTKGQVKESCAWITSQIEAIKK